MAWESACQCRKYKRLRFDPWMGKILWSRKWQPVLEFLPGKFHEQRSLGGYSHGVAKSQMWLSTCACTHTHTQVVATIILVITVLHYRALAIAGSPLEFLHLYMESSSLGSGRAATSQFRQGLCASLLEQVIWNRHLCGLSFLWPYNFVGLTQCVSSLHPTLIFVITTLKLSIKKIYQCWDK